MDNPALSRFLMVERHDGGKVTVLVHHLGKPKLMVEFEPRLDAAGNVTGGVLKRICAENSWNGAYGQYSRLVGQAEKFFHRSVASGVPFSRLSM